MYLTPASTGCSKVFKSFITATHVHNPLNTEYWPHFHTSIEETVDLSGTVSLEPSALKTPPGEIVAEINFSEFEVRANGNNTEFGSNLYSIKGVFNGLH